MLRKNQCHPTVQIKEIKEQKTLQRFETFKELYSEGFFKQKHFH